MHLITDCVNCIALILYLSNPSIGCFNFRGEESNLIKINMFWVFGGYLELFKGLGE